MDLSILVDNYLAKRLPYEEQCSILTAIERWMHHGLKKSNARSIFANLQKLLPLAYLRRLTRHKFLADRKTSALWASLLAAFMDTKCWTGHDLDMKDAMFCELSLDGAFLYLVDIAMQMSSTEQIAFFDAICRRVFSPPETVFQDPRDSLRLIIFHKWLTAEHEHISKPSLKDLTERFIDAKSLREFLPDSSELTDEEVVFQLIDSYSLLELVSMLDPTSLQHSDDLFVGPKESQVSELNAFEQCQFDNLFSGDEPKDHSNETIHSVSPNSTTAADNDLIKSRTSSHRSDYDDPWTVEHLDCQMGDAFLSAKPIVDVPSRPNKRSLRKSAQKTPTVTSVKKRKPFSEDRSLGPESIDTTHDISGTPSDQAIFVSADLSIREDHEKSDHSASPDTPVKLNLPVVSSKEVSGLFGESSHPQLSARRHSYQLRKRVSR